MLKLGCLHLCFPLSSVPESQEICIQAWNATLLVVIRLKSMKGQGNWWMFRVTTSSSPVVTPGSSCGSGTGYSMSTFGLKTFWDLCLRPCGCKPWGGELLGRGQCEGSNLLNPFTATSHAVFEYLPRAPQSRWDLQPLGSALSVAWPAQVYQGFKGMFFLYF